MFRKICFLKKGLTISIDVGILYLVVEKQTHARVAQLVEHDLAKVGVAGSSPVSRFFYFLFSLFSDTVLQSDSML